MAGKTRNAVCVWCERMMPSLPHRILTTSTVTEGGSLVLDARPLIHTFRRRALIFRQPSRFPPSTRFDHNRLDSTREPQGITAPLLCGLCIWPENNTRPHARATLPSNPSEACKGAPSARVLISSPAVDIFTLRARQYGTTLPSALTCLSLSPGTRKNDEFRSAASTSCRSRWCLAVPPTSWTTFVHTRRATPSRKNRTKVQVRV